MDHLVKGMSDLWNEERYMLAQADEDQNIKEMVEYANNIHSQLMTFQGQQQQLTNKIEKVIHGEEEKVLQTYTVPAKEVRLEAEKWKPAIQEEIGSLTSTKTIIRMTKEDALAWRHQAHHWKRSRTRKAPLGISRARIAACDKFIHGNSLADPQY